MNPVTVQRLQALEIANGIRSRRAQLKRDLHAGRANFADVLSDPPDWLLSARVFDIALSVPWCGRSKLHAAFNSALCQQARTFATITPDQRRRLLRSLRSWPSLRDRIGQAA